jgi:uncharacterized protein YccT (UPF0319 family)
LPGKDGQTAEEKMPERVPAINEQQTHCYWYYTTQKETKKIFRQVPEKGNLQK